MEHIQADITIIGAGVAGFSAAMAASKEGKKVVLLEKSSRVGGNAVQSNVGTICGAYYRSQSEPPKAISHPFLQQFITDLGRNPIQHIEGLWVVPYDVHVLEAYMKEQLEQQHIQLELNAEVHEVSKSNKRIDKVIAQTPSGEKVFESTAFVDCSGNGVISQLAGLDMISSNQYQFAAQVFRVSNITAENEYSLNFALKKWAIKSLKSKEWQADYTSLSVVPGSLRNGAVDLKFSLPITITDKTTQEALNKEARASVENIFKQIKIHIPSFEDAQLKEVFSEAGIRVQQRSMGQYILMEKNVLGTEKFQKNIATGTWPMEEWDENGKVKMTYFAENEAYEIPEGCLRSYALENLYFGGKNISATHKAIASARVIGTCIQTGFAAGILACK